MSNGTSKPRRAMQLGVVLIAMAGLLASFTGHASAQTSNTPGDRVEITEEFCINRSLGGPITYPHDNTGDGIADLCSLPRTRRATAARQHAMERMASELSLLFGHLFAQECLGVSETFGEPGAERNDECAAPRQAETQGASIPPVPLSPLPEVNLDSRFYSGPVVTSPSFCINHSFGGPITYPHDNTGDGIADLCSLPRTRRAAVARQNALERMASDLKPRFDVLFAEECLRVPATLGEPLAEAEDECAVPRETGGTGTPLPTPGGTATATPGPGTTTPGGTQRPPYVPPPVRPTATRPPTYHDRAVQNVQLDPGNGLIYVTWEAPDENASTVFKYVVQWRARGEGWSTDRQADSGHTGDADNNDTAHTITGLTNFTTYDIRILAQRGLSSDRYTPTLSATPGWSGPPTWPVQNALTSPVFGQIMANWNAPDQINQDPAERLDIHHYIIQWDTSSGFARDCALDTSCNEAQTSDTAHTIRGLSNTNYYVRVQGVTAFGPGVWSLSESYRLSSTRPDPGQPTGVMLSSTGDGTELTVEWTVPTVTADDPVPTDYFVQWRNVTDREGWSATDRQQTISGTPLATTTTVESLTARKQYEVRVQAINLDAPGRWSSLVRHTLGQALPPTNIAQDPGDEEVTVSWSKPVGVPRVTSYFLQWATRCSNSSFSTTRQAVIQSTQNVVSHTITNLTNNQLYQIRVRSVNSYGFGDWSSCISGEPGTLNAPIITRVEDSNTNPEALTVTWTYTREDDDVDKPHLSGFRLRTRRDGSTSWSSPTNVALLPSTDPGYCDNTGTGTCTYTHTLVNLLPGVTHDVQVLARNSYGDGAWSESSPDTPGDEFQPGSVNASESSSNIRSLDVAWSAPSAHTPGDLPNSPVTSYRVQYRRSGSSSWSTSSSSVANDKSSYTITGLSTGLEYQIRVVARTRHGDGPGSEVTQDSTATPGADFIPTTVVFAQQTNSDSLATVKIDWSQPNSAVAVTSYTVQWRTCGTHGASCGSWGNTRTVSGDPPLTEYVLPVINLRDNTYFQARVRANGATSTGGSSLYAESGRWLVDIDNLDTPSDQTDDTVDVTIHLSDS